MTWGDECTDIAGPYCKVEKPQVLGSAPRSPTGKEEPLFSSVVPDRVPAVRPTSKPTVSIHKHPRLHARELF
ncbi:hypothetical protein SCLCIDRAFT_1215385 [Scleroderma citrinum Foug A]|uniref:Uncharacterized protein n=1 Tax=Scleroderma citrinum Foug A TaxID=1036808 RepID=A0A0C3DN19_9AGAM|nr:hypothetical protein SCLCIDRAFT_1215385 [Scleroderma citrinum Foug A]